MKSEIRIVEEYIIDEKATKELQENKKTNATIVKSIKHTVYFNNKKTFEVIVPATSQAYSPVYHIMHKMEPLIGNENYGPMSAPKQIN